MASSVVKPNPNPWPKPQSPSISLLDLAFPSNSISMRSNHTKRAKTNSVLHTPTLPGNHPPEPDPPEQAEQPQSPRWNLLQRAAAKTLDAVETALVSRQSRHKLPATVDPRVQIAGNFAPVPEHPVTHNLEVTGTIPECINGVYLRNGANPLHQPLSGHHLFDGDGMIHAVMINSFRNSASYACRFTETQRLIQERELGRPVFPKPIGELHGHSGIARMMLFYARGLFGLIDHGRGIGVANAGLVYFNRRLLAMSEDDLPYHVRISTAGDLQTVGRHDFGQQLRSTMIAHPKIDPVSGDFFALSYNVLDKPYLKYFKFSIDGDKTLDFDIHIDTPTMIHDFAITENFVVIPDHQVVFRLHEMIKGGSPVIYDENKKSRFGILSKNAENSNNIIWIECPNTFCFHVWNAWEEEEDEVVVIGSCMTPPDSIFKEYSGESLTSVLSEMRLNLRTGESKRRRVIESPEKINLDAGMVNRSWLGQRTRFAYLAIAEPWPKVSGLAKVDLRSGAALKYVYGQGRYGGEPFFVARERDSDREDDGYILVFVHDENVCKSELQIIDAITLKMEASVRIPSRVPYGFHGTFITSKELEDQV